MIKGLDKSAPEIGQKFAYVGLTTLIESPDSTEDLSMSGHLTVWEVKRLVQLEFSDPNLSIVSLADRMSYHRGSLSRLFRRHCNETIIEYITEIRLRAAKRMLEQGGEKISAISTKCGFRCFTYFSTWFRKHTGHSPTKQRRMTLCLAKNEKLAEPLSNEEDQKLNREKTRTHA